MVGILVGFQNCNHNFNGGDSYEGLDVGDRTGDSGITIDPDGNTGGGEVGGVNGVENYVCIPANTNNPIELLEIEFLSSGSNKLAMTIFYTQNNNPSQYSAEVPTGQDYIQINALIKDVFLLEKIKHISASKKELYYKKSNTNKILELYCN